MGRPSLEKGQKREPVSMTIAPEILEYVNARIGPGERWKDKSHAFEYAMREVMDREEAEES